MTLRPIARVTLQRAFDAFAAQPASYALYTTWSEAELRQRLHDAGVHEAFAYGDPLLELGWAHADGAQHDRWVWDDAWLDALARTGRLAPFYAFAQALNGRRLDMGAPLAVYAPSPPDEDDPA